MSNNDWAGNLIKLGAAGLAGYGIYKGGEYLARKAVEHSQEQQRQRIREAQWRREAQQQRLDAQRREHEKVIQELQDSYDLGLEKLSNSDFGGSLHTFRKTLTILKRLGKAEGELATIYADIYRLMSEAQLHLEDYQGAITSLNQSLGYNSDNAESYALRAIAKSYNQDLGGAKADIAIAVSLAPEESRYQSIQEEIQQTQSQSTNKLSGDILRLHEKTLTAVAMEYKEYFPRFIEIMSHLVEEELVVATALATQLYVVSDIEIQLVSSIPQMSHKLPQIFVAYWQIKQNQKTLPVFDKLMEMFQLPEFQGEGMRNAFQSLFQSFHQKQEQLLALPSFESQLVNLDWIDQNAYKQAYSIASSIDINESQIETVIHPVIHFSKSVTNAFLQS